MKILRPIRQDNLPQIPSNWKWVWDDDRWALRATDGDLEIGVALTGDVTIVTGSNPGLFFLSSGAINAVRLSNGVEP